MPRLSALALGQADIALPPIPDHTLEFCFAALAAWAIVAARMVLARLRRQAADDAVARCRIAAQSRRGFYLPGLAR